MSAHIFRFRPLASHSGSIFSLIAIAIALVATLPLNHAFAHGVTLNVGHNQPAGAAFQTNFLGPWLNEIHNESGARIKFLTTESHSNDGETVELFDMVKERAADIVWLDVENSTASFPKFSVFALPLTGATSEGSSRALWAYLDANNLGSREFGRMRVIAASRHDAPLIHMRDKNVVSLSDLAGTSIATTNADSADLLSTFGASPVITQKSGMHEALTSGKVDGVLLSWDSVATFKLEELVKAHTEFPRYAPWPYAELSALIMNRGAYRSMADDLKQIIRNNSGADVSAWIGKVFDENAEKARQRAVGRGDQSNVLPAAEMAQWLKATDTAIAKRVEELDGRKLRGASLVGQARELLTEYDPIK